jgi:hypothetical protein
VVNVQANNEVSSLADIIAFLEGRCKALELLQDSRTTTVKSTPTRPYHTATEKVSHNRSKCNLATQLACNFHNDNHSIQKCEKFRAVKPRLRFLFAKGKKLL